MKHRIGWKVVVAVGVVCAAVTPAAADPGGHGNGPATRATPSGEPPGHANAPGLAKAPGVQSAPPPHAAAVRAGQKAPAARAGLAGATRAEQARNRKQPPPKQRGKRQRTVTPAESAKAAVPQDPSRGRSAEAQHHVIICHRTGSATNPYVVINISVRGWLHGHRTHPPLDGRSDILLKDPARPGEKLGAAACGVGQAAAAARADGTTTATLSVAPVADRNDVHVKGVAVSRSADRPEQRSARGALGQIATRTLPFTGLPLWIALLVGAGLVVAGVASVGLAGRGPRPRTPA